MSKIEVIRVNGREFVAVDWMLKIIDGELIAHAPDYHHVGHGAGAREALENIRSEVEALKGGDKE